MRTIIIKTSNQSVLFKFLKINKNVTRNKKELIAMKNDNSMDSDNQNNVGSLAFGKIKLNELEIKERERKLKALAENWKLERQKKEEYEKKAFGFSKNSEILNGRLAMFFLVTGLLTEYWTKQNIIQQVETIIRTLGLI
nr:hlip [Cryptomonas curvata]